MANKNNETLPAIPMQDVYDLVNVSDIINHLKKAVTEKWCYEIKFADKTVRGLGITGAMEVATIVAKLSKGQHVIRPLELMKLEETAETWNAVVKAGLFVVGIVNDKPVELLLNTALGYCNQPKLGTRRDGSTWIVQQPDKLAASKAQRMAVEKLLPDKWKQTIIQIALKEGKIQSENGENSEQKVNGGNDKEITDMQKQGIEKRIMNKHVDEPTAIHYKAALNKGMTKLQASRAIQTLDKLIKTGEEKDRSKQSGESLL